MATHVPRIYVAESLAVGESISLPEAKRHHLVTVLRLAPDDPIRIFNDSGYEYSAVVERATRKTLDVSITDSTASAHESPLDVTLVQSIAGNDRMDYALAKAVELGVGRIRPVFADNGKVKLSGERLTKKHRHWQSVVEAAAEQSGRLICPVVEPPSRLMDALSQKDADALGLVLALEAAESLAGQPISQRVELLIGPESGLSPREIESARTNGWHDVTLGPRVLRAETAGPAAIAALQTLAGDFSDPRSASATT